MEIGQLAPSFGATAFGLGTAYMLTTLPSKLEGRTVVAWLSRIAAATIFGAMVLFWLSQPLPRSEAQVVFLAFGLLFLGAQLAYRVVPGTPHVRAGEARMRDRFLRVGAYSAIFTYGVLLGAGFRPAAGGAYWILLTAGMALLSAFLLLIQTGDRVG